MSFDAQTHLRPLPSKVHWWLKPVVALLLAAGLVSCLYPRSAAAQEPPSQEAFIGTWMGTGEAYHLRSRVFYHIKREGEALTGTMDIPARKMTDIPVFISLEGDSVAIEAVRGPSFRYEGALAEEGERIEGALNGEPLSLSRTTGPVGTMRLEDHFPGPVSGITTGGAPRPDLFPIHSTGISTAPVAEAAETFLERLDPEQREAATFPVESDEWRHWTNSPFLDRRGPTLRDMSEAQREAALDLVRTALSARGFRLARGIMRVEDYIARLTENRELFGEWLYHVTVMGKPSTTEPWGFQLDGHHLILNFFILGDQVVATPRFFGTEPAVIDTGQYAGTDVLQEEQGKGLAFAESLSPDQRKQAVLEGEKTEQEMRSVPFRDNLTLEKAGIPAGELSEEQRERLLDLIRLYIDNIREGHAKIRMEEVRKHLGETRFAWIGPVDDEAVYYYRIQSPVLLIEFDHAFRQSIPGEPGLTRDHIHTVVRTPNGGDYGKSLLQKHYEAHEDNPNHKLRRAKEQSHHKIQIIKSFFREVELAYTTLRVVTMNVLGQSV